MSHHRLQRFHRWAMLWLAWFAAFLEAAAGFARLSKQVETLAHRWLDKIEHVLVCIIIQRAAPHVRWLPQRKVRPAGRLKTTAHFRAIIGCRMRRALRSKSLHQRIAALLQDIDVLVACLVRRLPRGLTRRRPILARPGSRCAHAPGIFPASARRADTS